VKAKLNSIFIMFTVIGAIVFILVPAVPLVRAGGAASEAARGGLRAPSSQAPNNAQASQTPSQKAPTGTWKFNRGQSDDLLQKIGSDDGIPLGDTGIAVPPVGLGLPSGPDAVGAGLGGVGGTGIGGLGGGPGGGSAPLPPAPASHRWESDKDRQKKLEYLMPAGLLTIEQKDNEFDFVDDRGRKLIFYTDGRKLRKSKDDKLQEFAAHWGAGQLTYDEKRPPKATITRTFELSANGHQMQETTVIDSGGISVPVTVRYVYDAAPASTQP
jgi:hypothetical protein